MSKFYVGQRVRIVGSLHNHWAVGKEVTIVVAPDLCENSFDKPWYGAGVLVDGTEPHCKYGTSVSTDGLGGYFPPVEFLVPIQPSGHQVISCADMEGLWQPSGVEA